MAVISLLIRNQASLVVQTHQRLLPPAEMGTAQQEFPVDYTPAGQVIAPYVSLVAIFIAAIVIGYVTD
jgi:hypothetical protein